MDEFNRNNRTIVRTTESAGDDHDSQGGISAEIIRNIKSAIDSASSNEEDSRAKRADCEEQRSRPIYEQNKLLLKKYEDVRDDAQLSRKEAEYTKTHMREKIVEVKTYYSMCDKCKRDRYEKNKADF